jgi:hypothetical protein
MLTEQGLYCRIDWCSSECKTWFDSLPKSSSPQKTTAIVDSKQYSRSSGETEAAKLPAAAKSVLQARDEDTGSDFEFEIDEEDLRLLKNARVRLEGPKPTSALTYIQLLLRDVRVTYEDIRTAVSWAVP